MTTTKTLRILALLLIATSTYQTASALEIRESGCSLFFRKIGASLNKRKPTSVPKLVAAHLYNRFRLIDGRWEYLQPFDLLNYSPESNGLASITGSTKSPVKGRPDIRLEFEVIYNLKDYSDNVVVRIKLFSDDPTIIIKNGVFKDHVESVTKTSNLKLANAKTIKSDDGVVIEFEVTAHKGIKKFFHSLWVIETSLSSSSPTMLERFYNAMIVSH